jgi:hypothetical protein
MVYDTEPVAEWLERLRCDHSEAVWAGSKPGACDCKESLVPGKKLALTGASGIREMQSDLHRLATTSLFWIPCSRCNMQWAKWLVFQSKTSPVRHSGSGGAGLECGLGHVWVTFATGCY